MYLNKRALLGLLGGKLQPRDLKIEGDPARVRRFFSLFDAPDPNFAIVTP